MKHGFLPCLEILCSIMSTAPHSQIHVHTYLSTTPSFSQYPFRKGLQSFYTCTFLDMHTPSIGPYPSREGHQSFYPQTPAHFRTRKLRPLACIPLGRGTGVFIHGSLHISRHGNSVRWPISLQGGAPEFLSTDPCTFMDTETLSIGLYPSREGHRSFYPRNPAHLWTQKLRLLARIPPGRGTRVFIHGPLHIYRHGNSVCWPISLQGVAPEFLSTDPCTFTDTETPSVGPYTSREGHQSFYPRTPAHFQTWKLHPLACIPPGRGTGVFIHGPLHIYGHGNSIPWPISLQGGAREFLSLDPCTFTDTETPSVGPYPSREGHGSVYPRTPAHFRTRKLLLLARIPPGRGIGVFIHGSLHIYGHGNSIRWPIYLQGGAPEFLSTDPCTFTDMDTPSVGPYTSREGHQSFYPRIPAHLWTWTLRPLARIPPGRGTGVFIHRPLHIYGHRNSIRWPVSLQGGAQEFLSKDPCTFTDTETPSIGPYPSREGHRSFYPWTPAHLRTRKLHPLAHIPPGRRTGEFIHGPLHISGHGNSIHWPVSLQGGAPEFLSTDPCTFPDTETPSVGPYTSRKGHRSFYPRIPAHLWTWKLHPLAHIPPGRGTRVFIHGSLHIYGHGHSVRWPVFLQGGAPESLSTDPCTFTDTETPSVGLYPSREGHRSFYPQTPAHFRTRKLRPLAHIPPGRGTGVFIHRSLHISRHGNSVRWPISLQGGAPEFLSTDPCTFLDMETLSVGPYPSREGHRSFYPQIPAHLRTWKLRPLAHIPPGRGTGVFIHGSLHISRHGNSVRWPVSLQGGAPEFLSTDPCTFPDMETPSVGPYPSREGHRRFYPQTPAHFRTWKLRPLSHTPPGRGPGVFIHRPLHISGHGNSVRWPISL